MAQPEKIERRQDRMKLSLFKRILPTKSDWQTEYDLSETPVVCNEVGFYEYEDLLGISWSIECASKHRYFAAYKYADGSISS